MRRGRGKMYIGHGSLCVCLSVCPSPHSHTTAWNQGVLSSCILLGGFAIGARISLLAYDNTAPNAKCQQVLVLTLCLITIIIIIIKMTTSSSVAFFQISAATESRIVLYCIKYTSTEWMCCWGCWCSLYSQYHIHSSVLLWRKLTLATALLVFGWRLEKWRRMAEISPVVSTQKIWGEWHRFLQDGGSCCHPTNSVTALL